MTGTEPSLRPGTSQSQELYLDLLMRVLTRSGFEERYRPLAGRRGVVGTAVRLSRRLLNGRGLDVVRIVDPAVTRRDRQEGRDLPPEAETMIGLRRLASLQRCVAQVLHDDVPGDLLEAGVWRGGASIFMRAALKAFGAEDRVVWVADSFQGLPPPDPDRYPADADDPHWRIEGLAVSMGDVRANFAKYGLLDDQVKFLPGWFQDTLPSAPIDHLAVLRLDGDMYESTIVTLRALYPKVSPGGFVVVDDYGAVEGCRAAVDDFRAEHGIIETMEEIDWTGRLWRRHPA
ncbi:MAG: TylF/MycF/NovP-related O-methyltransferase [Acidimicrobiales bacterium]